MSGRAPSGQSGGDNHCIATVAHPTASVHLCVLLHSHTGCMAWPVSSHELSDRSLYRPSICNKTSLAAQHGWNNQAKAQREFAYWWDRAFAQHMAQRLYRRGFALPLHTKYLQVDSRIGVC